MEAAVCSTPFGIKDQISWRTSKPSGCRTGAQRLSASKIKSLAQAKGPEAALQVLNAFRHQRSNLLASTGLTIFGMIRAQRLSASKIKSRGDIHAVGGTGDVLNAFRHQRSNLSLDVYYQNDVRRCSTPFGIKDQISRRHNKKSREFL